VVEVVDSEMVEAVDKVDVDVIDFGIGGFGATLSFF
jgi:hypothetical protein